MIKKRLVIISSLLIFIIAVIFITNDMKADEVPIPENHIYHRTDSTITVRPRCIECHTNDTGVALKPIGIFNHSSSFVRSHRFYASQNNTMCSSCHLTSFCADCHGSKEELKPSVKHFDAPERTLPHRGNYLFQHRIDGKIDPTPCFRCHGRQNNTMCRRCHR